MQTDRWIDEQGRENVRRLFVTAQDEAELRQKLRDAYNASIEGLPNVISILQERLNLKDPCPCGRSKSFERCCYWKLLQDPPVPIVRYTKR